MHKFTISALACAIGIAVAGSASAAAYCPSNNVTIVRISKITPGGTMEGFKKAIADHRAWYQSHGYKADEFIAAPVLKYDEATKDLMVAPNEVMTFHTHAGPVPKAKQDAAWAAYVAEYRANSEIASETIVCMP